MWSVSLPPAGQGGTDVLLLDALDAAALVPDDAACVLLVGSRARGWQHARSDLDVVVVTASPWAGATDERQAVALPDNSIAVAVTEVDGVRCQVKYWTESQILSLLDKVDWAGWDTGRTGDFLSTNECLLIERLPHAVALRGPDRAADLADRIRASAACSYLSLACLTRADESLEDVSGLWESGDVPAAVLAAQRAFVHVTDALTASLGVPGTDTKWRLRRVEATDGTVLDADEFWRLTTMQHFDAEHPERWLDHVTYRCSQIMLDVRLGR